MNWADGSRVQPNLSVPSSIRFTEHQQKMILRVWQTTNLSVTEIVRRAINVALPQILSGKVEWFETPESRT